ncbi:hypothetical protein JYK14_15520 [Siccirubricoccus sp. KC 17139]|uniref:Uncharacterized protein n=1 Tax=Siccirubricoccus soli TaxID=2899147 RepID=A0ABT1D6Q4_9PROT|nr:hypothetical protein [Siccirubricoccus soli]MCO6417559.1 hypothetical protein [Siccirubricoccus soli]MCP2683694.1 hypothetical protein [Siccirubricoccus soli]
MSDALPYRSEFVAALNLLAQACTMVKQEGHPLPILVGGAVVEFDTGSQTPPAISTSWRVPRRLLPRRCWRWDSCERTAEAVFATAFTIRTSLSA